MITNQDSVQPRKVDDKLTIFPLLNTPGFSFDIAVGVLHGDRGKRINHVSDRAYYIIEGAFEIILQDDTFQARTGDVIAVPRGARHGISGNGRFMVITSPPFDPSNETELA